MTAGKSLGAKRFEQFVSIMALLDRSLSTVMRVTASFFLLSELSHFFFMGLLILQLHLHSLYLAAAFLTEKGVVGVYAIYVSS